MTEHRSEPDTWWSALLLAVIAGLTLLALAAVVVAQTLMAVQR